MNKIKEHIPDEVYQVMQDIASAMIADKLNRDIEKEFADGLKVFNEMENK